MPVSPAKFDMNQCNESPLWGEKPDFLPVSKCNKFATPRHPAGNNANTVTTNIDSDSSLTVNLGKLKLGHLYLEVIDIVGDGCFLLHEHC